MVIEQYAHRRMIHCTRALLLVLTSLASAGAPLVCKAEADRATSGKVSAQRTSVLALAEKVADYQLATMAGGDVSAATNRDTNHRQGWVQGAFFVGLSALADHSANTAYRQAIFARGRANQWRLGQRLYHADDHVIGSIYLWAFRHGAGPESIEPLRAQFDRILAYPPKVGLEHAEYDDPRGVDCNQRWCWSDALFMAPPVWFELTEVTGDERYADYAKKEFNAVTDFLYDRDEHLYLRDSRFATRRGPAGEKVFWSRGVGWVFAGLARSIPHLKADDPTRVRMEQLFKEMADRLVTLQKPDGYWSPSLLADPTTTPPETSGTGFFTYGLAWGLKSGLLRGERYETAMRRGWSALTRAVHPDGKLGYVQQVSDRPDDVKYEDTQFYGVGAFLLAATAIADLNLR